MKLLQAVALCAVISTAAIAHVNLDGPHGGILLRAGSVTTISWVIAVGHTTTGWDLEYSLTGPSGPWIPIAQGLPAGNTSTGAFHSYQWLVPNSASTQVRVRVRQVNVGTDYTDMSNGNLTIADSLSASASTVSLAAGGTTTFGLEAGAGAAGAGYFLAGSVTGTTPGLSSGVFTLPLVPDAWFDLSLMPSNPFYTNHQGLLDSQGQASIDFVLPGSLPPSLLGLTVYHAATAADGQGTILMATPAHSLTFVP